MIKMRERKSVKRKIVQRSMTAKQKEYLIIQMRSNRRKSFVIEFCIKIGKEWTDLTLNEASRLLALLNDIEW